MKNNKHVNYLAIILMIFSFAACSKPAPSQEMALIEYDLNQIEKSDEYINFWKMINAMNADRELISNPTTFEMNFQTISGAVHTVGFNGGEVAQMFDSLYSEYFKDIKNENVKAHIHAMSEPYRKMAEIWAVDWEGFISGEKNLDLAREVSSIIDTQKFLENQTMQLKSGAFD